MIQLAYHFDPCQRCGGCGTYMGWADMLSVLSMTPMQDKPKSVSLTCPWLEMSRLSGFKSRWIIACRDSHELVFLHCFLGMTQCSHEQDGNSGRVYINELPKWILEIACMQLGLHPGLCRPNSCSRAIYQCSQRETHDVPAVQLGNIC